MGVSAGWMCSCVRKGISEATVCRIVYWVEDYLMRSGKFRLPGKKHLVQGFGRPRVVVIGVKTD